MEPGTEASTILRELSTFGPVLAIKVYRLALDPVPAVPVLPCLDHEAMLHAGVAPHLAAYLQDGTVRRHPRDRRRARQTPNRAGYVFDLG
jgi:hypothetical protein